MPLTQPSPKSRPPCRPAAACFAACLLQLLLIIPVAHAQQEQPGLFETLGKLLQPPAAPTEVTEQLQTNTRAIAPQSVGQTGKRLALVIGNDAYQKVSKLEKAGNDASAMARELKTAGFEVTLYRDLNYQAMVKNIDLFANRINGGDQVVVFFAGHGVQIKTGKAATPRQPPPVSTTPTTLCGPPSSKGAARKTARSTSSNTPKGKYAALVKQRLQKLKSEARQQSEAAAQPTRPPASKPMPGASTT